MSPLPPAPSGQALQLISALQNPENHALHEQALRAKDEALKADQNSYGQICQQLAFVLAGSDRPDQMLPRIPTAELETWKQNDPVSVGRLQRDSRAWIPFGQMAGLTLKEALLRPPILSTGQRLSLDAAAAEPIKETLLYALGCHHKELRNVASTVIATTAVSVDSVQPALHVSSWSGLVLMLVTKLQAADSAQGALETIRKMLEDGPREMNSLDLDSLVPVLLGLLVAPESSETTKTSALQSIAACLVDELMPASLALHFTDYLHALSGLAQDTSTQVRKWVCRSLVTLLDQRTEYLSPHLQSVCPFILKSTADKQHEDVALEACDFWLTFAHLEEDVTSADMYDTIASLLPQLIPILLRDMVYSTEKQIDLKMRNELDADQKSDELRPVFHRSKAHQRGGGIVLDNSDSDAGEESGYDEDDEDQFEDDDEWNEWTLRKCAAASLDSLANLYGSELILPHLLPALQEGLTNQDPWVQEASILGLGAVAEGCQEEMAKHMTQIHPFLMNCLAAPENGASLPQLKCMAAWTVGQYAGWAVEQVQSGVQGHLLAYMTEVFLARLIDRNRRVQWSCCAAFGTVIEAAGDLMVPYLEPIYRGLVSASSRFQGRSLNAVFDVLGLLADRCGSAIAEGNLPNLYVPPLLHKWEVLARHNPEDRTLLPLMEALASISMVSAMNFQPYALESFDKAMGMIEAVTLILTTSGEVIENEEDADPIVCALDLVDGLVEGLGGNFASLLHSSQRYGQHFLSVLLSMCRHDIPGVRMSALALLGDLARSCPALLEPALPQLLHEAISNMDSTNATVSTNAVWSTGEICVRCEGNAALLEPFVPAMMHNLIMLLMGNPSNGGGGRGTTIPGLAENAAACAGRLAKVNPSFVAPDLPRFLMGWCDGMAKISDLTEKRDAFQGFVKAVYANPQAIQQAAANISDAVVAILFAIVTWHMPAELPENPQQLLKGDYDFRPFPPTEAELASALAKLVQDMKASVGEEEWNAVRRMLPVNVRRLLRETYHL